MSNLEEGINAYEESDFSKAFNILMPLALTGDLIAKQIIGNMYSLGQGVEMDIKEAIKWYRPVAEDGHFITQNNLGQMLLLTNIEEGIMWLTASAEQNFPFAQLTLADIYSGVLSVSKKEDLIDYTEAIKWYKRSAELGFHESCHRLGEMYADGQGVEMDIEEAIKWYLLAAQRDYEPTYKVLANAYKKGLFGLTIDEEQAKYWLSKVNNID